MWAAQTRGPDGGKGARQVCAVQPKQPPAQNAAMRAAAQRAPKVRAVLTKLRDKEASLTACNSRGPIGCNGNVGFVISGNLTTRCLNAAATNDRPTRTQLLPTTNSKGETLERELLETARAAQTHESDGD